MINSIIESVRNASDRFRTLAGIYPVMEDGEPVIYSGPQHCDINMVLDCTPVWMRCYTRRSSATREQLKEVASFLSVIEEPCYGQFLYLEDELLVFHDGRAYSYIDVSIEKIQSREPLALFAAERLRNGRSLASNISQLTAFAERHSRNTLCHSRISSENIYIQSLGQPLLTGFGNASRGDSREDVLQLARIASILCLACSDLRGLRFLKDNRLPGELVATLLDGKDHHGIPSELIALIRMLFVTDSRCDVGSMINVLKTVPVDKIGPDNSLSAFLDRTIGTVNPDVRQPRVKYSFIGEPADMMMRAYDGESWCYLDKDARVAIPGPFTEAFDFYEGIAVVEMPDGYGLINREGKFIIEPAYDDIEIDQTSNRLVVTREGFSGLVSRTGEFITPMEYDQIVSSGEGIFIVKKNGRYGYITRDGDPVTEIVYEDAESFRGGFAKVVLKGNKYLIGTDGVKIDEILLK